MTVGLFWPAAGNKPPISVRVLDPVADKLIVAALYPPLPPQPHPSGAFAMIIIGREHHLRPAREWMARWANAAASPSPRIGNSNHRSNGRRHHAAYRPERLLRLESPLYRHILMAASVLTIWSDVTIRKMVWNEFK